MNTANVITPDSRIVRDNEAIFTEMDGEIVIMSIERGEYYGVNPVGTRIWGLLETPQAVSALCEAVLPDYQVDKEQGTADIMKFLNKMLDKGIIRLVEG